MESGLQIDNVQSFVEATVNNDNLWRLLLGREVIHFVRGRGRVSVLKNNNSQIWVNYPTVDTIPYEQTGRYTINYQKERFIKEFDTIAPPFSSQEILEFLQNGIIIREVHDIALQLEEERQKRVRIEQQRGEQKRLWLEAERGKKERRLEEERQERLRLEQQRREQHRLRLEAERQERLCLEQQHREQHRLRLEAERREKEQRLEEERQERVRREAEKQILLKSLKENFEQDFLNAYNFYLTKCTEHISFEEYQAEKSNYVQFWVKRHLQQFSGNQTTVVGANGRSPLQTVWFI